jgi:hypothetical protein
MALIFTSVGVALVATLGTLILALTGTSPIPLPGFPEATRNADREPATSPQPGQATTPAPIPGQGTATTTQANPGQTATPSRTQGRRPTEPPGHPKPTKTK